MLDPSQLEALAAVIRTGSFDAAARALSVTPSAVSQRIRQLEERLGAALVIRGQPAAATEAGRRLVRHADELRLLEHTLLRDIAGGRAQDAPATIRIAVNADSLDSWFIGALAGLEGFLFDLTADDQDHSVRWLKRGEVMAAVTSHPGPVQGCDAAPLGWMRYIATAAPGFAARHFNDGVTAEALARAPALVFNRKDRLQDEWAARETGRRVTLPSHMLPSTHGFVEAALSGLGWGLNPESLVRAHLREGNLVALGRRHELDVPLYWLSSRAVGQALEPLTRSVRRAARAGLVQNGDRP